jgi:hypothetical protein
VSLRLADNRIDVIKFNGAHASSGRTADKTFSFANRRAEAGDFARRSTRGSMVARRSAFLMTRP